jgi:hypothetical protein
MLDRPAAQDGVELSVGKRQVRHVRNLEVHPSGGARRCGVTARQLDHRRREVDAGHLRAGEALGDQDGELARTAADVQAAANAGDVGEQILDQRREDVAKRRLDSSIVRTRDPPIHRTFPGTQQLQKSHT